MIAYIASSGVRLFLISHSENARNQMTVSFAFMS